MAVKKYQSFSEFYPFYLSQHQNIICRRLHFIGSSLIILLIIYCISYALWQGLWFIPVIGYGFAWLGHVFFEKNKPATFTYPFYSLLGDWVMFKDMLTRKIKF
ncbi:DUF962 domain-containing protein [Colwellia sp. BRX10-6]|uniref:DUF962 domain-containing protein n=1 Tax=unclassified Colwellia TaxID=196834 RepID=UPI0015F614CD|nr:MULTISPECIES: DUF962 domain-containing protein [unclassified Colwellia]MBA6370705.1 DUF962 domain-containing protein [Colwellia sp. BRX8-4]MBA6381611.1 DUF962 domain-containing protein [Colwellia sp. BRX10-9]MBA6393660.1 DUF962 domain-containing protein [Colwellia sp. BRX10-6]